MRLLVVSQYFWPENFRINDLVTEMVRRGHEVTVLTGLPNYPEGRIFQQYRATPSFFANYEGAEVIRVPMTPRWTGGLCLLLNYLSFALSASALGVWKLRGRQFDAIFTCQLSPVTVGIPAVILRAVKRAPMVFWILDLWPDTLQAVGVVRSPRLLQMVGKLVAFIYRRCDLILAQSKSFIPQIRKYVGQQHLVEYLPSWAETLFDGQGEVLAPEVPVALDCFNVVFTGNIGDAQDFPAILSAAENLRHRTDIRWLIVGDGRLAEWVRAEIKRRGLQDQVLMLGRYPVERMPSFLEHADALLVSLKAEPIFAMTIPGKLQSYLAAGIPVVAMLNGEGANLILEAGAGLTCSAADSAGLAQAVLQIAELSATERLAMGQRGKALYMREFGRQVLLDRLEAWLQELVKNGLHKTLSHNTFP